MNKWWCTEIPWLPLLGRYRCSVGTSGACCNRVCCYRLCVSLQRLFLKAECVISGCVVANRVCCYGWTCTLTHTQTHKRTHSLRHQWWQYNRCFASVELSTLLFFLCLPLSLFLSHTLVSVGVVRWGICQGVSKGCQGYMQAICLQKTTGRSSQGA